MQQNFTYQFPAIKGIQAGREFYSLMCPLEYLPSIFNKSDIELPPELSSQRLLNKSRIPAMTRYMVDNPEDYIFSSLTASVDSSVQFSPIGKNGSSESHMGTLTIPMSANFAINDGQHRLAAIRQALKESDHLKYETISIVLFIDRGLEKSQQMFADLNRYAAKPTKSLSLLYDHRDPLAKLSYDLTKQVSYFKGMAEMSKTSISNRSKKLFTLSSIYQATGRLLNKREGDPISDRDKKDAIAFWESLGKGIPDWKYAAKGELSSFELRQDQVHAHGVALQALANVGVAILDAGEDFQMVLKKLSTLDWRRANVTQWEGRALVGGVINRSQMNVILTGNVLKAHLNLKLTPSELKVEQKHLEGNK